MNTNRNPHCQLADRLRAQLHHLERCNSDIEKMIKTGKHELCRMVDRGEASKSDTYVGKTYWRLEYAFGNTTRYTMLIGVCSFLEEAMRQITERLVPDWRARTKSMDRTKNWLDKSIRVLSDSVAFDTRSIQPHIDAFCDFITLRNCIVHAWGEVAGARSPAAVKDAAERLSEKSCQAVRVSPDGFLLLDDAVITGAINTAEAIADAALSKLGVSMT